MKYLLILSLLALSACSTTVKHWHVHPDDMARFQDDTLNCRKFAIGSRYEERLFDTCLQKSGYRLELVSE